jgi:Aspartyl protease
MTLKQFLAGNHYLVVKLSKSKSGHLYLNVKVNKTKGIFILDTGAGATIIDINKKVQFKLSGEAGKRKASGAGGGDIYIEVAKDCQLEINKYLCPRIKLNLMDLSHVNKALLNENSPQIDGIIGSDILFNASGIIDYKNLSLFLKTEKNIRT